MAETCNASEQCIQGCEHYHNHSMKWMLKWFCENNIQNECYGAFYFSKNDSRYWYIRMCMSSRCIVSILWPGTAANGSYKKWVAKWLTKNYTTTIVLSANCSHLIHSSRVFKENGLYRIFESLIETLTSEPAPPKTQTFALLTESQKLHASTVYAACSVCFDEVPQ